jgi:hypothetical protein
MRFFEKIQKSPTGCWMWCGSFFKNGYGRIWKDGKTRLAHRVSYEIHVGEIPVGMTIDHKCENKGCVNPDHLQPVTARENQLLWLDRTNGDRTLCPSGHEFSPANTYRDRIGGRHCRACNRLAAKRTR